MADAGFTVHRLAVREIPRSGKPEELLDRFGISARHIVEAVKSVEVEQALAVRSQTSELRSARRQLLTDAVVAPAAAAALLHPLSSSSACIAFELRLLIRA